MANHRIHKTRDYSTIHNEAAHDKRLSWKAKGLIWYLLTKPDGWEAKTHDLVANGKEGKASVRSGLKELEENGYLLRWQEHGDDGRFIYHSEVFESKAACSQWGAENLDLGAISPPTENQTLVEEANENVQSTSGGKPATGKPSAGEPEGGDLSAGKSGSILNTDQTITDQVNTDSARSPQTPQGDFVGEPADEKDFPEETASEETAPEEQPAIATVEVLTPVRLQQLEGDGVIGGGCSAAATLAESENPNAPHLSGIRAQAEREEQKIRRNSTRNINTTEARLKHSGVVCRWMGELVAAYVEHLAPLGGNVGSEPAALDAWCEIYQDLPPDPEFFEDFGIYAAAIARKRESRPSTIPCNLATFIREHSARMDGAIAYLDKNPPGAARPGTYAAKAQAQSSATQVLFDVLNDLNQEATA